MLNIKWKVKYKDNTEIFDSVFSDTCSHTHVQYMFAAYQLNRLISHELLSIMFGINFRGLLY